MILGLKEIEFWNQPDGKVRATRMVIERLRRKLLELRPDVLYVTHDREMHPDHRAAVRIVDRALAGLTEINVRVMMYEVWTPMQEMDYIEDISDVIEEKMAAVRAYRTQCDVLRFDDAILGLNRYRGEMHSWPGGPYAEIFRELDL
jgi:LmbE family N-acetylglucosaminyl deacetylase